MMGVLSISSESDFEQYLSKGGGVFVDFFAEWCGPCKMVAPKLEQLAAQYPDVTFLKVDVDKALAQKYSVRAMPTFLGFLDGKLVDQVVGANLAAMEALISRVNKPKTFAGAAFKLGGGDSAPEDDAAKAREARAKAAEARFAQAS